MSLKHRNDDNWIQLGCRCFSRDLTMEYIHVISNGKLPYYCIYQDGFQFYCNDCITYYCNVYLTVFIKMDFLTENGFRNRNLITDIWVRKIYRMGHEYGHDFCGYWFIDSMRKKVNWDDWCFRDHFDAMNCWKKLAIESDVDCSLDAFLQYAKTILSI
jgi:hypothetical protein